MTFEEISKRKTENVPSGLHPIIRNRWSPRAFADRDVAPVDLELLLEAARWAASSGNEQPWRFIVARRSETEKFAKLLGILVERNQQWAKAAPVLMLTLAKTTLSRNGAPNHWAWHDTGLALGNLMAQATSMGIVTHGMAGFDAAKAREAYALPDDIEPVAAVAVGHPGDAASLPEPFRERELEPRMRRPVAESLIDSTIA